MDDYKTIRILRSTLDKIDLLIERVSSNSLADASPKRNKLIDDAMREYAFNHGFPWGDEQPPATAMDTVEISATATKTKRVK